MTPNITEGSSSFKDRFDEKFMSVVGGTATKLGLAGDGVPTEKARFIKLIGIIIVAGLVLLTFFIAYSGLLKVFGPVKQCAGPYCYLNNMYHVTFMTGQAGGVISFNGIQYASYHTIVVKGGSYPISSLMPSSASFDYWSLSNNANVTLSNVYAGNTTATIKGNVTIASNYYWTTTFTESGLPAGATWTADYDGVMHTSSTNSISFNVSAYGSLPFSISNVTGTKSNYYVPSIISGSVFSGQAEGISFASKSKIALVGLGGSSANLSKGCSGFGGGCTTTSYGGGGGAVISIGGGGGGGGGTTFTPSGGNVTTYFNETGLPGGTKWYVLYDGLTSNSTGSTISFNTPTGNFQYYVYNQTTYNISYDGNATYVPQQQGGSLSAGTSIGIKFAVAPLKITGSGLSASEPSNPNLNNGTAISEQIPTSFTSGNVDAGQKITFSINGVTGGYTPYVYQWYIEVPGSSAFMFIPGATAHNYTFAGNTTGTYVLFAIVRDRALSIVRTMNITLDVVNAPIASISPSSATAHEGQTETYTVNVSKGIGPFTVELFNLTSRHITQYYTLIASPGQSGILKIPINSPANTTLMYKSFDIDNGAMLPFLFNSTPSSITVTSGANESHGSYSLTLGYDVAGTTGTHINKCILPYVGTNIYAAGTVVNITALAAQDCVPSAENSIGQFIGWTGTGIGSITSSSSSISVMMLGNITEIAQYSAPISKNNTTTNNTYNVRIEYSVEQQCVRIGNPVPLGIGIAGSDALPGCRNGTPIVVGTSICTLPYQGVRQYAEGTIVNISALDPSQCSPPANMGKFVDWTGTGPGSVSSTSRIISIDVFGNITEDALYAPANISTGTTLSAVLTCSPCNVTKGAETSLTVTPLGGTTPYNITYYESNTPSCGTYSHTVDTYNDYGGGSSTFDSAPQNSSYYCAYVTDSSNPQQNVLTNTVRINVTQPLVKTYAVQIGYEVESNKCTHIIVPLGGGQTEIRLICTPVTEYETNTCTLPYQGSRQYAEGTIVNISALDPSQCSPPANFGVFERWVGTGIGSVSSSSNQISVYVLNNITETALYGTVNYTTTTTTVTTTSTTTIRVLPRPLPMPITRVVPINVANTTGTNSTVVANVSTTVSTTIPNTSTVSSTVPTTTVSEDANSTTSTTSITTTTPTSTVQLLPTTTIWVRIPKPIISVGINRIGAV